MWDIDPLQVSSIMLWYAEKVQVITLLLITDLKIIIRKNISTKELKEKSQGGITKQGAWGGGPHLTQGNQGERDQVNGSLLSHEFCCHTSLSASFYHLGPHWAVSRKKPWILRKRKFSNLDIIKASMNHSFVAAEGLLTNILSSKIVPSDLLPEVYASS